MSHRVVEQTLGSVQLVAWRRDQLAASGFPLPLAARVARDSRYDLHTLIELVERGCPPELAVRIVAPLDEGTRHDPGYAPAVPGAVGLRSQLGEPAVPALDEESREWLRCLRAEGSVKDEAIARLHALLLRAALFEVARRRPTLPHLRGNDLDDIANQAADDALVSVLGVWTTSAARAASRPGSTSSPCSRRRSS